MTTLDICLQPIEHLQIIPSAIQPFAHQLLQRLPALLGDHLYECFQDVERQDALMHGIAEFCPYFYSVFPHPILHQKSSKTQTAQIAIAFASQTPFIPIQGRKVKYTLKEVIEDQYDYFRDDASTQVTVIVSDYWDQKLMQKVHPTFQSLQLRNKVIFPLLHHGSLLTPICYL